MLIVRERRRNTPTKIEAIRGGRRGVARNRGEGRGFHARELVGSRRRPTGGGVGESAAPLEDKSKGCESERKEGQKKKESGSRR